MARPNLKDLRNNWCGAEGPWPKKLRRAAANFAIKFRTGSNCCGNHGDVGCCIAPGPDSGTHRYHGH